MEGVCPEGDPNPRKRMIEELLTGRNLAVQLQGLLSDPDPSAGDSKADEIVEKILRSFTESISAMSSCGSTWGEGEDAVSGDSGESETMPCSKAGRGSCKRRRGSHSLTTINPTTEDCYSWRKYGQKEILNSKFPRCYYRCTHKHDQGCKATKQVQQMEDDPNMYRTTYIGGHTCREITRAPQMIPDSHPREFDTPGTYTECKPQIRNQDHYPVNPSPHFKDENKEDSRSDLTNCVSGSNQALPDFHTISSIVGEDFPIWSFSDDCFRSFSNTSFMDRCIEFDGDFQFAESDFMAGFPG